MIRVVLDILLALHCIIKIVAGSASFADHWVLWGMLVFAVADLVYKFYKNRRKT